jgi:hypothetical protein
MSRLPHEACEEILSHVNDDTRTLYAASLISRGWRIPSQRVLFRSPEFRSPKEWSALLTTLQEAEHLRPFVHELRAGCSVSTGPLGHKKASMTHLMPQLTCVVFAGESGNLGLVAHFPNVTRVVLGRTIFKAFSYDFEGFDDMAVHELVIQASTHTEPALGPMRTWLNCTKTAKARSLKDVTLLWGGPNEIDDIKRLLREYATVETLQLELALPVSRYMDYFSLRGEKYTMSACMLTVLTHITVP